MYTGELLICSDVRSQRAGSGKTPRAIYVCSDEEEITCTCTFVTRLAQANGRRRKMVVNQQQQVADRKSRDQSEFFLNFNKNITEWCSGRMK